jgi:AhpD family alkylhydroperoxidase
LNKISCKLSFKTNLKGNDMQMQHGKKLYILKEAYWIFFHGIRTIKYMLQARKKGALTLPKIERVMLAVTEVNGCGVCSYAHTRVALEAGMSGEEIAKLLSGEFEDVPKEELAGVIFAQHYADSRGNPSRESWERVVEEYGASMAMGILGAIRGIMIGNVYGIAWSSFFNRFKGKADPRSNLAYEAKIMTGGTLIIPLALFHALIAMIMKKPIISFADSDSVS